MAESSISIPGRLFTAFTGLRCLSIRGVGLDSLECLTRLPGLRRLEAPAGSSPYSTAQLPTGLTCLAIGSRLPQLALPQVRSCMPKCPQSLCSLRQAWPSTPSERINPVLCPLASPPRLSPLLQVACMAGLLDLELAGAGQASSIPDANCEGLSCLTQLRRLAIRCLGRLPPSLLHGMAQLPALRLLEVQQCMWHLGQWDAMNAALGQLTQLTGLAWSDMPTVYLSSLDQLTSLQQVLLDCHSYPALGRGGWLRNLRALAVGPLWLEQAGVAVLAAAPQLEWLHLADGGPSPFCPPPRGGGGGSRSSSGSGGAGQCDAWGPPEWGDDEEEEQLLDGHARRQLVRLLRSVERLPQLRRFTFSSGGSQHLHLAAFDALLQLAQRRPGLCIERVADDAQFLLAMRAAA